MCHMPMACGIHRLPKIEFAPNVIVVSVGIRHLLCSGFGRGGCFRLNSGPRKWTGCRHSASLEGNSMTCRIEHPPFDHAALCLPLPRARHHPGGGSMRSGCPFVVAVWSTQAKADGVLLKTGVRCPRRGVLFPAGLKACPRASWVPILYV